MWQENCSDPFSGNNWLPLSRPGGGSVTPMRTTAVALLVVLVGLASEPAHAQRASGNGGGGHRAHAGGGHHGGHRIHHGGVQHRVHHGGVHHHHGGSFVSVGFWGPWWYPPYPYYYPAPVAYAAEPVTYVEQNGAPEPTNWWYYCDAAGAYYPYAKTCSAGWRRVSPTPPSQ
jgi:hypothetical protein